MAKVTTHALITAWDKDDNQVGTEERRDFDLTKDITGQFLGLQAELMAASANPDDDIVRFQLVGVEEEVEEEVQA